MDKTSTQTVTDPFSYIVHSFWISNPHRLPLLTWIPSDRLLHSLWVPIGDQWPEFLQWLASTSLTFVIWFMYDVSLTLTKILWLVGRWWNYHFIIIRKGHISTCIFEPLSLQIIPLAFHQWIFELCLKAIHSFHQRETSAKFPFSLANDRLDLS